VNIIEKQVVKLVWRRFMKNFKRFVPLVAVVYIAALTIARSFGLDGVVSGLSSVGGLIGLEAMSPVSGAELTAAAAALGGVILKVYALVNSISAKAE
jgi:hypothetical protein